MSRPEILPMLLGEKINTVFDFTDRLAAGETITDSTVGIALYSGTDASPTTNNFVGSSSFTNTTVTQTIQPTLVGNIYQIFCNATTSATQILQKMSYLAVIPGEIVGGGAP